MLPTLSRSLIVSQEFSPPQGLHLPAPAHLDLPEKAIQFGTGAFLRGFVEYFLDQANRSGRFNGRVVMVGSTGSGRHQALTEQDGLYTLTIQGVSGGELVREDRVIGSVSRALSASEDWAEVLACARKPELELIFSNTTEVGIVLDEEDTLGMSPPRSFPGKLAAFLIERGRAFDFDPDRGVAVIPCELIEDNGDRLREIVLALADRWGIEPAFAGWIEQAVPFCNTLVDRIVPGTPGEERLQEIWQDLGYRDEMLTACEVYRLFAVEGDARLAERQAFPAADEGVVVTPDVGPYRERKVRVLNGTHTAMVPAALLCGLETVQEAVEDELVGQFVRRLMFDEIVPTLDADGAEEFARDVFDRFSNPFIRHALLDITLQGTMKMRVRNVPTILRYGQRFGRAPASFAFGLASFLVLMRGEVQEAARARGARVPVDDGAEHLNQLWQTSPDRSPESLRALATRFLDDQLLWGEALATVPGLTDAVAEALVAIEELGAREALSQHLRASVA